MSQGLQWACQELQYNLKRKVTPPKKYISNRAANHQLQQLCQ
jgi:hypothetical protein